MSYSLKDQKILPQITDQTVALFIAQALRHEYRENDAVVKRIARATGTNPLTVKKWYEGRNAPKSSHLLSLAQTYPSVRQLLADWVGIDGEEIRFNPPQSPSLEDGKEEIYTDRFVSINVRLRVDMAGKFNERQLWFLGQLQQGTPIKGEDIARIWRVATRTAWRDVNGLVEERMVCFSGPRKTGKYLLVTS